MIDQMKYVFITIIFLIVIYLAIRSERKTIKHYKEYKELTIEDSVDSKIKQFEIVKGGVSLIKLENGSKIWIPYSKNYDYNPNEFIKVLEVNDSIVKKTGTDTMMLYKDCDYYVFRIGHYLNKP